MRTLAIVLILFSAQNVSAQVFISEIKYTGNEWIEVSNSGEPSDISLWKFYEGGTNHKLKSVQGGPSLSSGSYAIIANDATAFLNEHSGFSGILFDSSFSLLDVGETISIKSSDTNIVDTVSYTGIKGSKNSTQKIGGMWSEATPTPGTANSVSQNVNTATVQTSNTVVAPTTATPQVTAQAGPQTRVVLAGAPIIFEGKIAGLENSYGTAQTTWSFGDGASAEGESVTHTYYYPGEYTAVLDVVSGNRTATDKMLVRVVLPNLSLRTGGDTTRSFFTIENGGGDELNISGWQVVSNEKTFTFPKNTILGARKSATFASEVTGLVTPAGNIPELLFPNGTRVDTKVEAVVAQTVAPKQIVAKAVEKPKVTASAPAPVVSQVPKQQSANVIDAISETPASLREERGLWPWYVGSAFLGALALLCLRLTQKVEEKATITAEDFEIIEETDDEEPH